jgi:hypothetical protein
MRGERRGEREAWTAFVDGTALDKASKYGNVRAGKYQSKHEADVAQKLDALVRMRHINNLGEQVSFTLIEGRGRVKPIKYIADFVYFDLKGVRHVLDAKGCKTPVYRLKKKMLKLLHDIDIEEV